MSILRAMRPLQLSCLLLAAAAPALHAQTADDLFSLETMHDVHLSMSSRDFQELVARYEENVFFPADLQWGSLRIRNVGVRVRGRASRVQGKPGLHIEFSRYVTGQRFLGMDSLDIDNRWQDPALFREQVAMAFFERMGIPAPRESFCRLHINNALYGLYALVEGIDASFLQRRFGDTDGYLYEFQNVQPYYGEYLGDHLDAYKPFFEPRTRRRESDAQLYSPIRDLLREINHDDDAVWRERVEQRLDVNQFITYVAVEAFLAEPDGVLGNVGMSNFYLHRRADEPQHRLIPWDKDLSFNSPTYDVLLNADQNELFRRLMADDDARRLYLQRLEQCARAAAAHGWLQREITRRARLVAEAAYEDERKAYTNEDFDATVAYLQEFARLRPGNVLRQVAAIRQMMK